jgi:hypothetical protein
MLIPMQSDLSAIWYELPGDWFTNTRNGKYNVYTISIYFPTRGGQATRNKELLMTIYLHKVQQIFKENHLSLFLLIFAQHLTKSRFQMTLNLFQVLFMYKIEIRHSPSLNFRSVQSNISLRTTNEIIFN